MAGGNFYDTVGYHQHNVWTSTGNHRWQRFPLSTKHGDLLQQKISADVARQDVYNATNPRFAEQMEQKKGETIHEVKSWCMSKWGNFTGTPYQTKDFKTQFYEDRCTNICNAIAGNVHPQSRDVILQTVTVTAFSDKEQSYVDTPVFHVCTDDSMFPSGTFYVDGDGRLYPNWNDYLARNTLPRVMMCYPKNGIYAPNQFGYLDVEFAPSPANKTFGKAVDGVDVASDLLLVACGVGSVALLCPPLVPVVAVGEAIIFVTGAIIGVWKLGLTVANLYDRRLHGQSIGLEACWREWGSVVMNLVSIVTPFIRYRNVVFNGARKVHAYLSAETTFGSYVYRSISSFISRGMGYISSWASSIHSYLSAESTFGSSVYRPVARTVVKVAKYIFEKPEEEPHIIWRAAKAVGSCIKKCWDFFWSWAGSDRSVGSV